MKLCLGTRPLQGTRFTDPVLVVEPVVVYIRNSISRFLGLDGMMKCSSRLDGFDEHENYLTVTEVFIIIDQVKCGRAVHQTLEIASFQQFPSALSYSILCSTTTSIHGFEFLVLLSIFSCLILSLSTVEHQTCPSSPMRL